MRSRRSQRRLACLRPNVAGHDGYVPLRCCVATCPLLASGDRMMCTVECELKSVNQLEQLHSPARCSFQVRSSAGVTRPLFLGQAVSAPTLPRSQLDAGCCTVDRFCCDFVVANTFASPPSTPREEGGK